MNVSKNNFTKLTPTTGTGSMSRSSLRVSTNNPTKVSFKVADRGWSGQNITSNELGFDEIFSGTAFGVGEFGGIKHFAK